MKDGLNEIQIVDARQVARFNGNSWWRAHPKTFHHWQRWVLAGAFKGQNEKRIPLLWPLTYIGFEGPFSNLKIARCQMDRSIQPRLSQRKKPS